MKDEKKYSILLKVDGERFEYHDVTAKAFYDVIVPKMQNSKDCIFEGFSNPSKITIAIPKGTDCPCGNKKCLQVEEGAK
jgi:hypothetical protein